MKRGAPRAKEGSSGALSQLRFFGENMTCFLLDGQMPNLIIGGMDLYAAPFFAGVGATIALELIVFSVAVWFVSMAAK